MKSQLVRNNRRVRRRRGRPAKIDYPLPDAADRLPLSRSADVRSRLTGPEAEEIWDDCRSSCPWLTLEDAPVVEMMANQWQLAHWAGRQLAKLYRAEVLTKDDLQRMGSFRPVYSGAMAQCLNAMGVLGMTLDARHEMRDKLRNQAEADQRDTSSDDLF